jgi:hypothetical protein
MNRNAALIAVTAVALGATSCRERASLEGDVAAAPADDSIVDASATAPLTALLDSGNAAFLVHDYARARDFYLRATQLDSTFAAGWFGVYMAEDRLGNAATAAYAMERATRKR